MPAQRRSVATATRHTAPSAGGNNATTLMMGGPWPEYVQIWAEQVGGGTPATINSITTWHNLRKARGWSGATGGAWVSIGGTPYGPYDGTANYNAANQFDTWRTPELHYSPGINGDPYLSRTFQKAPFNHVTLAGVGMTNYRYMTDLGGSTVSGTPLWPWHNDTQWGGTGAAAAVAAGEGSAAWSTAVASALTPTATFSDPFSGTTRTFLADFKMFCQTCALFGHDGIGWDSEMYNYANKDSSSWATSYPQMPGGQSTATTRLYVKLRGQQLATVQASIMPNTQITFYHHRIPGGWFELYRYALFGDSSNSFAQRVYDSFIAGLASVAGIEKVMLRESEFYKNPVMSSWDNAYLYDHMGILARMSTLFTDAERLNAMRRLGLCGMLWPTSGNSGSELGNGMNLEDFRLSLRAAVKWSMHGQVDIWALSLDDDPNGGIGNPAANRNHGVFESAFQSELVPGVADSVNPVCTVTSHAPTSSGSESSITLAGNVTDNMAVHRVEWSNVTTGGSGSFQLTFNNTTAGWNPQNASQAPRNASIPITFNMGFSGAVALAVGANPITVTAYDTHGNSHAVSILRTRT